MAASNFVCSMRFIGKNLQAVANKSMLCPQNLHRNAFFSRGIKKLPKKVDKKDGHFRDARDVLWEQRLKDGPVNPLAKDPASVNIIAQSSPSPNSTFTLGQKRLAGLAVISMLCAVLAFKSTFGSRIENTEVPQNAAKSPA